MTGREALADALSAEMDVDIDPEFMAAVDVLLIRLALHGFKVVEMEEVG